MRVSLAICAVTIGLVLLGGCQPGIEPRVVKSLPAPVFADEQPVVVTPRPALPAKGPTQAKPAATAAKAVKPKACPVPEWEKHAPDNGWKYIIVHHSATVSGSANSFDRTHRTVNQWDELGYHFVIGNGRGSRDGQVEIGSRWVKQKHGAHCKTDDNRFNDTGIGICLVGNFESGRPTPAQLASLQTLVSYLAEHYDIPINRILGHSEAVAVTHEHRGTKCPGKFFDMDVFRQAITTRLASAKN